MDYLRVAPRRRARVYKMIYSTRRWVAIRSSGVFGIFDTWDQAMTYLSRPPFESER